LKIVGAVIFRVFPPRRADAQARKYGSVLKVLKKAVP
jgi:hypothetical protein